MSNRENEIIAANLRTVNEMTKKARILPFEHDRRAEKLGAFLLCGFLAGFLFLFVLAWFFLA